MTTRNYVYKAYPPATQATAVREQMVAAHRYRNKLVEIELARRAASEETIRRLSPEYAAAAAVVDEAEARVEAAYKAIKAVSQKARKKVPASPEMANELADAKAAAKAAYDAAKQLKADSYKRLKELQLPLWDQAEKAIPESDSLSPAKRKSLLREEYLRLAEAAQIDGGQRVYERDSKVARATCGCFWGTYLTIEDAAKDFNKGAPPRFARYCGEGTIAVQLQGGLSVDDAMSGDDRRLKLHVPNQEELATRGKSRGLRAHGVASLRIGSDGRDPIWAEFPVVFHRPLPPNATIVWSYIHCRKVGQLDEWSLRITVNIPEDGTVALPKTGVVALHCGWRKIDTETGESLRVATWVGDDGEHGELILPPDLYSGEGVPGGLMSVRDTRLEEFRKTWLEQFHSHDHELPDWLRLATSESRDDEGRLRGRSIDQWTSQSRFSDLCWLWFDKRIERIGLTRDQYLQLDKTSRIAAMASVVDEFPGEFDLWTSLDAWRNWDKHLAQWQANQRRSVIARRDQIYRTWAKQFSLKYRTLVITDTKWTDMLAKPEIDEAPGMTTGQRNNGRIASPGRLVLMCREKFVEIVTVPSKHVTMACHKCGHVGDFNRKSFIHQCSECCAIWDQDQNAARNQLARGLVTLRTRAALDVEKSCSGVGDGGGSGGNDKGDSATPRKTRRNRKSGKAAE
ncbi:hypothetical protein [Schlesneria sp. T3-172]|uniref:zinc ribbon domain-containing protein n=1 Tax=Schlesneria sphaerica TaxID=3373610 RepID=UPI0037C7C3C8